MHLLLFKQIICAQPVRKYNLDGNLNYLYIWHQGRKFKLIRRHYDTKTNCFVNTIT